MSKVLGAGVQERIGKYLGSYIHSCKGRKQIGQELIDKLNQKLQGWKASLLFQAGRLVLTKRVLEALPL